MPVRDDLSPGDAEALALGRLAEWPCGLSARSLESELSASSVDNLWGPALDGALSRLVTSGHLSVEGPMESRVYVVTEKGRARLTGGRHGNQG